MVKESKKDKTLVARCTKEIKEKIDNKAKAVGKSESAYIIDCCLSGTERKSDKLKRMHIQQVKIQEELNQMHYLMEEYKSVLPEEYTELFYQQMNNLGGVAKCQF